MKEELIELIESELGIIVSKSLKSGLNYWQILGEFLKRCAILYEQAEVEYRIKGGK